MKSCDFSNIYCGVYAINELQIKCQDNRNIEYSLFHGIITEIN